MNPLTVIAVINGSLKLAEDLIPVLHGMVARGEVTVAEQLAVREKYESLKAKADGQFQGDHWQIEP